MTNQTLGLKLDALRYELRSEMHDLRAELRTELHKSIRQQTWALMTTMLAALALFATTFGVLART